MRTRLLFACSLALATAAASCDPVHTSAVDALGGETPGVPRGPNHRPGQPCIQCHDGALGNPPAFSVAGTVYETAEAKQGYSGVTVRLTDAQGHTADLLTNTVGNFYASPSEWTPTYPVTVLLLRDGQTVQMHSHVGRDGSCAGCHFDPQGPDTPGHVYFSGAAP